MISKEEKSKIGKKSRKDGSSFELFVRKDLEKKGWIVIKNPNNVIEETKLVEEYAVHAGNNNWIKRMEPETKKYFKQGKAKYNPFTKRLMMNSGGFPDFLCIIKKEMPSEKIRDLYNKIERHKDNIRAGYKKPNNKLPIRHEFIERNNQEIENCYEKIIGLLSSNFINSYEVIGVESKINGYLDKEEKEKCKWLLDNKIFSKILIAFKKKEGRKIKVEYEEITK